MNILELISTTTKRDCECQNTLLSLGIDVIQSFANIVDQYIYLLNFADNSITCFSSENPEKDTQFIPSDKVDEFIHNHIPEEELPSIIDIDQSFLQFTRKIDAQDKKKISLHTDFHLKTASGIIQVSRVLTPLFLDQNGEISVALCMLRCSAHKEIGFACIKSSNSPYHYVYNNNSWQKHTTPLVNDMEFKILMLSTRGFTVEEIASTLFRSIATIKTYKRRLFKKLAVSNMSEAIALSINYQLNKEHYNRIKSSLLPQASK